MYQKLCFVLFLFTLLTLTSPRTHAETHVADGYLYNGGYWTKEESPYILEDNVFVPGWQKLTINPGVVIMSASTTDGEEIHSMNVSGDLEIRGTREDPVRIENLGFIYLNNGTTSIDYGILKETGIDISREKITINSSKISGAETAVITRGSQILIMKSEIVNNSKGILSNLWFSGPPLVLDSDLGEIGGIGNAEEIDSSQNIIDIHDSVIEGNNKYAILNNTPNTVEARDNWWGNSNGPMGSISGPIITDPWKTKDPRNVEVACCSNVLFLPGFEASRLYRRESGWFGTTTNTLWEPNRNDDVRKLYLDSFGKSLDSSIYTSDILDSAFGIMNIYKNFASTMEAMVAENVINSWTPFAYDWRTDVENVVSGNTQYATSTKNLIKEFENLAKSSKTGKVSIIAHSNGGLVAKVLGQEIQKKGEANLLDKVILVATPQLGTPQAIAGMLHGDGQSYLGGLILSKAVARTFGLNMPGAYGLLPSKAYMNTATSPTITFGTTTVSTYSSLVDFLTGEIYPRYEPKEKDVLTPAILGKNFLKKAESIHNLIDFWSFPTTTKSLFLSGWGKDTTKSLNYLNGTLSLEKSRRGDGTVLTDSSKGGDSETVYFNQGLLEHDTKKNIEHSNILESDSVQNIIKQALGTNTASLSDLILPAYMYRNEPNVNDYPWMGSIVVSVHSPLDIDVYDSKRRHIGLVPLKDVTKGHDDSDLMWLDNTLGGQYEDLGGDKYVTLPSGTGETYSIELRGTGTGTFTFQVQKYDNHDFMIANSVYKNLPVTPLLIASTSINSLTISPPLNLDVNGDGKMDIEVMSSTTTNPLLHLDSMKIIVQSLKLKPSLENNILKKIERIRLLYLLDKNDKMKKRITTISDNLENKHWNLKNITENEKKIIIEMFNSLLDSLEK